METTSYGFANSESGNPFNLTEKEYQEMWIKVKQIPDKFFIRTARRLTNYEEWIIWIAYNVKPKKDLAKIIRIGQDRLRAEYKRLLSQNGPKGPRPDFMV